MCVSGKGAYVCKCVCASVCVCVCVCVCERKRERNARVNAVEEQKAGITALPR